MVKSLQNMWLKPFKSLCNKSPLGIPKHIYGAALVLIPVINAYAMTTAP